MPFCRAPGCWGPGVPCQFDFACAVIDGVIISHSHIDHWNGIPGLAERFPIGAVYISHPMAKDASPSLAVLRSACAEHGIPIVKLSGPSRLSWGEGSADVAVLHPANDAELQEAQRLNDRLVERALAMDGTCTGEHGIGLGKKKYLVAEHGADVVDVMRSIKQAIDPRGIMNPGKILP